MDQIKLKFAAFVMTYERPQIICETIEKIFAQSLPPEKVLVVDNSASYDTQKAVEKLNDHKVEYLRVGYNAGPAGAAKIGLERLSSEGYKWIHWADDDDPPKFIDSFEILLSQVDETIGVIGAVGSKFDWKTGLKKRFKDPELRGLLLADSIGGGYCMIVNASALTTATMPDERLFFGMEEFDFCQRIRMAGFKIVVSGELMYRYRQLNNKLGIEKKPSLIPRRSFQQLNREYYSYRNAIFLMRHTYKKSDLVLRYIFRATAKIPFGFFKGLRFGFRNSRLLSLAIIDGMNGRMGKKF
jgi:GT2 family glycosyltransferase